MAAAGLNPSGFFVYILYRDAALTAPFYVGMARRKKRLLDHRKPTYLAGPTFKAAIARSVMRRLGRVPYAIVAADLTEVAAYALEAELIRRYGRVPHGPLVNRTDGGPGASGLEPEVTARRAAAVSAAQAGSHRPPISDWHRQQISEGNRRAHREGRFVGAGMTGKKHSEATREKMRQAALRRRTRDG